MPAIEIDTDIHEYLLHRIQAFGESASDVLRRELGITKVVAQDGGAPVVSTHELSDVLESPGILRNWNATERYLLILSAVHAQRMDRFDTILSIRGTSRVYFAKTRDEIIKSGYGVEAHEIPKSPYWAMTNASTPNKTGMLHNVLIRLDYSDDAIRDALAAMRA